MNIVTPLLTTYRRLTWAFSFIGNHQNPERSRRALQNQINNNNPTTRNTTRFFAFMMTICLLLVIGVGSVNGATYYSYTNNSASNSLTSWWTATNGTGSHPGSFTTAGDVFIIQNANTMTLTASWTVSGSVVINDGCTFNVNQYSLTIGGTTTVGNGTSGNLNITSTTGTETFTGLVTINAGGTWNNSVNEKITFQGGITNNGTFTAGTGTQTFNTNNQALTGMFSIPSVTITGVTLTNNNSLTVGTALSGNGGLTQAANATLNIGGTSSITTLTATATGNTVNYTGTSQTINSNNYYNLTLSGGGTDVLQTGTTNIGGNFTTSGSVKVAAVTGLTIAGNVILGSGTTFTAGAFTHNVAGNWTNNGGTCTSTGSTINFNGTAAQTIGGSASTTFNNLTINNSAGVALSAATTVSGTVTLTSGILTTTTTNLLSVTNTATTAISGGFSNSTFINGPVKWTLPANLVSGSTYNYPVGSGTTYLPFALVNPTTTGTTTAQVQAFATGSGGTPDASLTSISSSEYWSLTTTGNFTNSSVSLTRQSAITPLNTIGVSTTAAGTYTYLGGTAGTNGVTGSNTVSGSSEFFVLAQVAGASFWYKADGATSFNGTTWHDENNSNNATVLTTGTGTVALANNTINFNPSLTFTNVSRQMLTNSTANVQSLVVVTLPARSSTNTNLNADYAGLIGAASDNGIRLDATGYIWSGNATNSGTGIGLNNNDWSYISTTTGISRINGISGWAFSNWHIVNQTRNAVLNSQYYLGGYYSSPRPYYGSIAEVMAFPGATVPQQNSVETYLGVKYGITLGHDYIAGDGATTVYAISGYANNIAGLGNDNTYGLNQKVSASINIPSGSSRIVMATTNDFTSSNQASSRTALTNGQYLIWGDNGGATTTWTTSGSYYIVSRTWEVQNTGSVGAVNFQIDLTSYPISASGSYALLTATNSGLSSGVTVVPLTNTSGSLYTANITFPAGTSYFTITSPVMAAIYVRKGGYGTKDGTSWANAMATIQEAVETSNAMTTKIPVYVAAGDYYRDSNYTTGDYASYTSGSWNGWTNTFVMRDGVNVYGAFPEFGNANNTNANGIVADTTMRVPLSTATLYLTTLHAGPSSGSTQNYRVLGPPYAKTPLNSGTGLTTSTKWDGFELTGADMETDASGGDDICGGGVFTVLNSTISNCIIDNNKVGGGTTNDGAGAEMYGGTLLSCMVSNNNGTGSNSAGTINIHAGGSNVINSLIYKNVTTMAGGAISISTTTYNTSSPCYIINNTMANNTITGSGYACEIHIFGGSGLYFYNNAVWNNPAVSNSVSGVTSGNEKYNAWPNLYSGTLGTGSFVLNSSNTGTTAPYFVNPTTDASADYRLQSISSALYNKGSYSVSTLVPTTDIRGVFRNTPPEIGCYELASRLYYVNNATGTDAVGYGLNWSNPYKTVQYAINQYSQYDFPQVWVAKGNLNYTPTAGAPFNVPSYMNIYGGFAGNQATEFPTTPAMITSIRNSRNLKLNQTTLAGNGSSVLNATGTPVVIDGFTITTGTGTFAASLSGTGDTIRNCKIINNATSGLQLATGSNAYNVVVADNTGDGVKMAGTANLVNGSIANNTGVGINSSSTTATVINSILWGNSANINASGSIPNITYTASAAAAAYNSTSNTVTVNNSWWGNAGNMELYQRSPNFKTKNNYELLLISPCLGKGLVSANPLAIDANGKPRTYSSTIDMGAFEKWDGVTVNGSTVSNVRQGWNVPLTNLTVSNDTAEVMVTAGTNFNMGNNTTLKAHWLELMQDTISTHLSAQLTSGTITADSVLYVRRFSKTLGGGNGTWGVWTFFGIPFGTAPLNALDGAIDENTVRIETYNEATRAKYGPYATPLNAWQAGRLSPTSTMNQGTGYALSFNSKVAQTDVGQTVIFSSPALSPVTFTETSTPTANVTLGETPSATSGRPYWYDCGWNLIANPLPQTAGINTMWASTSSKYYGAAYFYKPYTDNYDVYPSSMLATTSSAIAPNAAFFVQTDVDAATATFTAGTSGSGKTPLVNMDFVRPVLSSNATDATTASAATVQPATFQFKVTGGDDYCNTFVIFDPRAHADMEPMEDNPTMEGITAQPALQLSTTATGSATSLAINRLPFVGSTMTVPMQVYVPVAGSYTITMPVSDTIAETVLLQDSTGGLHNLTTGGYTFTTTTDKVTNNYTVIFSGKGVTSQVAKGVTIVQDQRNVIISSISTMQQVALYGEAGQTYYLQNPSSTQVTLQLPPSAGVYLLKVVTADGVITKKLVNRQ